MRNITQAAFTVRELLIALRISEGKAGLHELKPEQRKVLELALQINRG